LKKVFPGGLPARVHVESVDTVLNNDTANTVNKWISERRENAGVEKERSRSMILAWRTKHRLRNKSKLTVAASLSPITPSED